MTARMRPHNCVCAVYKPISSPYNNVIRREPTNVLQTSQQHTFCIEAANASAICCLPTLWLGENQISFATVFIISNNSGTRECRYSALLFSRLRTIIRMAKLRVSGWHFTLCKCVDVDDATCVNSLFAVNHHHRKIPLRFGRFGR